MRKIGFYTLGCKVNQYETESLKELFSKNGYVIGDFDEPCDIYVINSCTVTATGDKKSRQAVSRARRLNDKSIIALIGCYAQHLTDKEKESSEADIILGNANKLELYNIIEEKRICRETESLKGIAEFCETPVSGVCSDHLRGYIKIQDGCNRFCSYCIIPYVRGNVRSRSLDAIHNEAEILGKNGKREIVLTGIQVGAYGDDLDKSVKLIDAVEAAASASSILRVRLSSVEPIAINRNFLERCKKIPEFCCHFHLSLQSGCDKILKAMNRRYTTKEYFDTVNLIREFFPDAAITTDIIAGFPGETEEDFAETLEFAKKCKFSQIHAFPYSPREGTRAAKMPDLPLRKVRNERAKKLISLSDELHKEFISGQIGKSRSVYVEKKHGNMCSGYTDNYIYVEKDMSEACTGEVKVVTLSCDIIKNNIDDNV